MAAVVTAVVAFAVPLAIAARQLLVSQEWGELQGAALVTAARTDTAHLATGDQVETPPVGGITIEVLDARRRAGIGSRPVAADPLLDRALRGTPAQGQEDGQLVAVVPLVAGEVVVGAVRASSPASALWRLTGLIWAAMAVAAAAAVLLAWAVTRRRVRVLVGPVERLAVDARALGGPVFTRSDRRSGLPEVDSVADALDETAGRLQALLTRERAFSAHASHQLRTPLAGLELILEEVLDSRSGDPWTALGEALTVARRLEGTIDDVLVLTRPDSNRPAAAAPLTMRGLADEVTDRWHGELARAGRRLSTSVEPPETAAATSAPAASVRQILDVLLANALHHGRGPVQVRLRRVATHLAVDVEDDGAVDGDRIATLMGQLPTRPGALGLPLARQIAETEHGRVTLSSHRPTTFTVLLPSTGHPPRPAGTARQSDHGGRRRQ